MRDADWDSLTNSVFVLVTSAIDEDWKANKGPACVALAQAKYSVTKQCTELLAGADERVERWMARPPS